jgi:hypothetical protein
LGADHVRHFPGLLGSRPDRGALEVPLAIFYRPQTVYSQPDLAYPAGEVADGNYPIIGKTTDGSWFMLQTPLGNTWFPGSKLAWFGDLTNVSVVQ